MSYTKDEIANENYPPCGCIFNINCPLHKSAPDMYEALKSLQSEIRASLKFDVKKHYSLMLADVATSKAIAKAEGK